MNQPRRRYFRFSKRPGRPGYIVKFHHPISRKQLSRGLGTRDRKEAAAICRDLRQICNNRAMWSSSFEILEEFFDPRAIDIFFSDRQARQYQASNAVADCESWRYWIARLQDEIQKAADFPNAKALIKKLLELDTILQRSIAEFQRRHLQSP